MKRELVALPAMLCLLLWAGCATTPEQRARETPEVLEALPEEEASRLLDGKIALGDTPEMVYLAWGPPHRRHRTIRHEEELETWTYVRYRGDVAYAFPHPWPAHRWYYDGRTDRYLHRPFLDFPETMTYRTPYVYRRVEFRENEVVSIERIQE